MNFAYPLRQIAVITGFEARRKVLSWRMLFPMLCATIICILAYSNGSGAASGLDGTEASNAVLRPFVASASLVLAISATVMSTESLSEEFERGSGYITFTKPLSRNVLFAGKFLSGFLPSVVVLAFYYAVTFAACFAVVGEVPGRAFTAIPLAILYLVAVTGVCMLFSSLAPRGSMAMMVAFLLLVVLQIFMQNVGFDSEPWYSIGYESGILGDYVLGNQTEFYMDSSGNLYTTDYVPELSIACAVMSAYAVLSTLFAAFVFRYRNM